MRGWRAARRWLFAGLALAALGGSGCGKSSSADGDVSAARSALTTANGLGQNGLTTNGLWNNGLWNNGLWNNGLWNNGLWNNGLWNNGLWNNGLWNNGLWNNGLWNNGLWNNGLFSNGLWNNGVGVPNSPNDVLRNNAYARQLLQYIYSCAMPATTYDTILDPNAGAPISCSTSGSDGGAGSGCDLGYECVGGKCVVPLRGGGANDSGLAVNDDKTTWWRQPAPGGATDLSTGKWGQCDETCQRWISACVLARTNAYGVHVEISMRAPADAPDPIKAALAVSDLERNGNDAGTSPFSLREGAYYGNIFATTPVNPPPSPTTGPDGGAVGYSGPEPGNIVATPSYFACAGPGSNIPEVTKRFCSSQGDQVVIQVPGICLTNTTGESGICTGEDTTAGSPTLGAIQDCYTGAGQTGTLYKQVITVYLEEPLSVCGNTVCEAGESDENTLGYCPTDCHTGTWGWDIWPSLNLGNTGQDSKVGNGFGARGMSALAPKNVATPDKDWVVVAGNFEGIAKLGDFTYTDSAPVSGMIAKYASGGGDPVWTASVAREVHGVAIAPSGDVIVMGGGFPNDVIWIAKFSAADGAELGTWQLVATSLVNGKYAPETFIQQGAFVTVDSQDNVIVGGDYTGDVTFGAFHLPIMQGFSYNNYLVKLAVPGTNLGSQSTTGIPSPNVLWARRVADSAILLSLSLDATDDIVLVTHEDRAYPLAQHTLRRLCSDGASADGATGLTATTCSDGSTPWTKTGTNVSPVALYTAAAADATGAIYAAGYLESGGDVGGGPISAVGGAPLNGLPPFVVKYGADGSFKWANYANNICPQGLPDCQYSKVESVAIDFDPTGNPIVAALGDPIVGGAIDFTGVSPPNTSAHQLPIFPSYSRKNLFLAAYSDQNNGQSLWAKQIPMILSSGIFGYGVDSHGYVVISGNYSGSMQADGRMLVTGVPEQEGYVDSFVAALAEPRQCGAPPTIGIGFDANGAQVDTVPAHIFAEATSPAGAVVFFTPPTAYDNCSPPGPGTIGGRPGATVYCAQPPNTTFGFGTSTVTCTAYDPFGDSSSTSFPVTVADTKPPVFAPFGDISRPATSAAGASVPFAPAATDQVDGSVTAVCTPASGTLFADGKTTPVTCTATDQHGNQSQMSFSVTVVPVPPTMTCVGSPGAPVIIATPPGTCGVTVSNGGAAGTCAGGAGGVASCTFDGHASETLGPGTHALAVLGTAGDGSTAGCTSYVQIVDDQSPTIQCADKTVECAGHTTTVTPAATCTDNCGCTVTCPPVALPLGTSLGGCTASDHTNSASCQSHLTVVDTRPPVLKLPCTTIVHGTGTSGAAVSYSASASDACDGAVAPSCSRASGSTFPYGITTVTCSASDAHGHTASGSFKVEVEYNWSGVLQPINADGSSIFKLGRTVPVKFQLTGGSAGVTNLLATLSLAHVSSSITGTYVEAVSTSAATTGNVFRYDATSKQYIFNLATDGLSAGTWRLSIDLGDGLARTVDISLR